MLEYDRIDASEGTDFYKTKESRKCIICNYYYFFKINFRFQPKVCDLIQKAMNFNNVTIVFVKGND